MTENAKTWPHADLVEELIRARSALRGLLDAYPELRKSFCTEPQRIALAHAYAALDGSDK